MKYSEELELQLHRARLGLIPYKQMEKSIKKKKSMTHEELLILLEVVRVSPNYQDSLSLNKLVIDFGNTITLH